MFPIKNPVQIFAIVMVIVLIAPIVFERLRIPGIIGLIVAGIIIGPHTFNILDHAGPMELLGEVGLLYIMFIAGIEIDLNQFSRQRNHSIVFGAITFFIPLILGTTMGYFYLEMSLPAAILLASMFSSHTLVTYPIASRLGLSKSRSVTTAIGGTLITDTAALLLLAAIAGMTAGEVNLWFWVMLIAMMSIYVSSAFVFLPRIGRWFFRRLEPDGVTEYVFVLTAVLVCAWLAHTAGLEPIIGAFLAGLILNPLIPERSVLMNRIQFVGNSLFIPFFLITVGMLVNLRMLLVGLSTWNFAISMLACAIAAKWLAAAITRRILSYNRDEGHLIFGLSINQAAATLAAVMVGYRLELFDEAILTGTIFMIMGTCFAGSWITDQAARRVALTTELEPYNPADAPQRIMVPLSNPAKSSGLMGLACILRSRKSDEPLYPLTVIPEGGNIEARVAAGESLLGNALLHAISANVPATPVTRVDLHVAPAILNAMRDYRISTVVVGWDGEPSSRQRIFGRILDALIEQSHQMIIIARVDSPLNTKKRLLVALPPLAERHIGLELGVHTMKSLAQQLGASLTLVTHPDTARHVDGLLDNTSPKMPVETMLLGAWNTLPSFLERILQPDDLTVMMGVRKGRLAWQPALDRLPSQFRKQLPERDFLVFYLPESRLDEEYGMPLPVSGAVAAHLLPPERIRLDLDGCRLDDSIRVLLESSFVTIPEALKRLTAQLINIGRDEPVELTPGAILLHTHTADVAAPAVHLGVNRDGFDVPKASQPPQVLLLLLSPADQPPEQHLQMLAMIARWIRRPNTIEDICRSVDAHDLPPLTVPPPGA